MFRVNLLVLNISNVFIANTMFLGEPQTQKLYVIKIFNKYLKNIP